MLPVARLLLMFSSLARFFATTLTCLAIVCPLMAVKEAPLEFSFRLPKDEVNPFARELFAKLRLPDGSERIIPAFVVDLEGVWMVRARRELSGTYSLEAVLERKGDNEQVLKPKVLGKRKLKAERVGDSRGFVRIDPRNPLKFAHEDGTPYFPLGTNCAWEKDGIFDAAFASLAKHGLNWSRVWMCHWGHTNMEWLPGKEARSPQPGWYSLETARRWDAIVSAAETNGVHFQMVFQHHGQWSSEVNSNWSENPWNSANGGFLSKPGDFFRDPRARTLMKQKLRYTIARWSYSPAILAWELFNEVMYTDAMRLEKDQAIVADWHREMADYIRSIDPYRHLITTSTDEVNSPLYAPMDFIQPHRYSIDMVATVTGFDAEPLPGKPVFYGEAGDDRIENSDKPEGYTLDAISWAGLCGGTLLPAQQWYHDRLIPTGRIASIGLAARFARAASLETREDLVPFQAEVPGSSSRRYVLPPAFFWQKRKPATIPVHDGSAFHPSHADIPHFMVGTPAQTKEGYTDRVSFAFSSHEQRRARVRISGVGLKGATLRAVLDGQVAYSHTWPEAPSSAAEQGGQPGLDFDLAIPAGDHRLDLINDGEDSIRFEGLELDREMDVLACFGRKAADLAVLFVWHRDAVFTRGGQHAQGTVKIPDVAAGRWRIQWWDPETGPSGFITLPEHSGGVLAVPTPAVSRFAAAKLEKIP